MMWAKRGLAAPSLKLTSMKLFLETIVNCFRLDTSDWTPEIGSGLALEIKFMNLQSSRSNSSETRTPLLLTGQRLAQWTLGVSLALGGVLFNSSQGFAAEQVMLRYGILERSISVEELSEFAETGKTSRQLRTYLRDSGQDPDRVREFLSNEVEVRQLFLDGVLNSAPGEVILDKMGEFVHTSSGEANRQALRSALVLSASDDDRISLIEVLQNYPTQEVHVNGRRVASAYRQIRSIQDNIATVLDAIGLP